MDSRDLIIIAVVGIGGWLLWKQYQSTTPQPAANVNPAGASSMVAGAAAQTVLGGFSTRGLLVGALTPSMRVPSPTSSGSLQFTSAARTLLAIQATPQPVALTPTTVSSPSTGIGTTNGVQPPPQRLSPIINTQVGLRGVY